MNGDDLHKVEYATPLPRRVRFAVHGGGGCSWLWSCCGLSGR
jgi:hypothetical protein